MSEAEEVKSQSEAVKSRLKCIFGDFLPEIIIRKLTSNLTLKDLPTL